MRLCEARIRHGAVERVGQCLKRVQPWHEAREILSRPGAPGEVSRFERRVSRPAPRSLFPAPDGPKIGQETIRPSCRRSGLQPFDQPRRSSTSHARKIIGVFLLERSRPFLGFARRLFGCQHGFVRIGTCIAAAVSANAFSKSCTPFCV